jgi:hypothetical protein
MSLSLYADLLHSEERALAESFRRVGEAHAADVDVFHTCNTLRKMSEAHVEQLRELVDHEVDEVEPVSPREGPVGLLRDLQDLYVLAARVDVSWTIVHQVAMGARDAGLLQAADGCDGETKRQLAWLLTRLKQAAPQALLVSS